MKNLPGLERAAYVAGYAFAVVDSLKLKNLFSF